jgi:hypothetical protein
MFITILEQLSKKEEEFEKLEGEVKRRIGEQYLCFFM